jgi:CO/xanthine dehydrogenase FAD-binding subunit
VKLYQPKSTAEALRVLASESGVVPVAGGTDVLVHWPTRPAEHDKSYLDLSGLDELRGMRWADHELQLGALATYWDVIANRQAAAELPLLVQAARLVGAIQIQARGTWAGNIVNASPAADGVPVLMAYDATVVLQSVRGREEVPLAEFYTGYKQLRKAGDQLVVAVRVPRIRHILQRFHKVGSRRAQAIAKVGLAVTHSALGWRVVVASMAPTVRRCPALERLLASGTAVRAPDELLPSIAQDTSPIDDIRSTAEYRHWALARVLFSALRDG